MAKPPHTRAEMRAFYAVWQVAELAADYRYTTPTTKSGGISEFSRHCFITTERPTTPLFRVTGIVIKTITLP
jgi:hypothetical protein